MDVLSRRRFFAVATLTTLASTTRVAAQGLVLPNGHRRSGRNLEINGTIEAGMVGIPIALGDKGPFLFAVATVGHGFSVRSALAETMGAMVRPDGSAALPPAYVGDLALERSGSAQVVPPGWGLPQPFAGVIGLDVFGDLSVGLLRCVRRPGPLGQSSKAMNWLPLSDAGGLPALTLSATFAC